MRLPISPIVGLMLFRLHFLLYCIFVSYNQFLFFFALYDKRTCDIGRMCVCHMFNKVLTYLLTYLVINSNLPPILHRYRDIALERSKIATFFYPSLVKPPDGGVPLRRSP